MSEPAVAGSIASRPMLRGECVKQVLLITASYMVAAWLGYLLTWGSSDTVPLLPAAGLALAALLGCGFRCWPGVWLGAFLFNFSLDHSAPGLLLAMIVATGATLQALLGAVLTHRFIHARVAFGREGDVWRFLLYSGPVACLLSASIAMAAFYAFGRLAWTDLASHWLLWWSGEALGVLLFSVPILLAWPSKQSLWKRSGIRVALPLLVTAVLLGSSNYLLAHLEKSRAQDLATKEMQEISEVGFNSLPGYIQSLRSIERLFAASSDVTAQEFSTFTARTIRLQGILSVDWAPLVRPAQRGAFQAQGYRLFEPDVHDHDMPVSVREAYFPVAYTAPQAGNEAIVGLDHAYDASRRVAMQHARDSADAVAIFKDKLRRTSKPALIAFMPVYQGGLDPGNASLQARRQSLRGFVVGVFDVEQLFAPLAAYAETYRLNFRVTNITPGQPAQKLAGNLPPHSSSSAWKREVEFAGMRLRLEMQPNASYWQAGGSALAQLSLFFSVVAGFLVAFAVLGAAGRHAVTSTQVAERTAALQEELRARQEAEDALRESEQDLDTTLHSIGDGVLATDAYGCITRMNPVAEQLTGWSQIAAKGRPVQEVFNIVNEKTRLPSVIPVARVLQTGKLLGLANHTILIARDGSEHAIADSAAPIRGVHGELRGVVLVFRDVSQERAAEIALQTSEERYRQFVELTPNGVFVESDGRFVYLNPSAAAMLGAQSPDQLVGKPMVDFLHPDSRELVRERLRRINEENAVAPKREGKWLRLDGSSFIGESAAVPYQFQDRQASLVVLEDISARKKAEDQLSQFFEISLDMLCIANADGYFKRINPAFVQTLGWSVEELLSHPFLYFVHPDDHEATLREVERQVGSGEKVLHFVNRYRHKDGTWRVLSWQSAPYEGGFMFATARDVTQQQEIDREVRRLNTDLEHRVEERSAALNALHAKEEEVRAIVDNLFDCVISIDAHGTVRSINPAVQLVLGYAPEELIGHNVSQLMPEPHRSQHDGYLARYLSSGEARIIGFSREVEARHKNGELIPFELAVNRYEVHGEVFFTGTLHDIRERKQLITELTKARTAAEDASRAKSEFLANMSHEIRTPMNAIIGLSHLCMQTQLDSKQRDYVGKVHHSARTLLGILNDILDFSKIEAGRLNLEEQDFELQATLANVDSVIGHLARDKGLEFDLHVAADVPRLLRGDALRLGQVLLNLAGNAVKFTQRGSVTLSVVVKQADAQAAELEFSVKDTGIGLSPEQSLRLFKAFSQADTSTTRKFGGTGLGLVISRRLVEMMGGELWVESELGVGSDFRFTARFAYGAQEVVASPDAEEHELAPARERLMGAHILLAEDNPFNQQVGMELLESVGATVSVVNNGYEALEALALQPFDLVLMDVQMPEMDGYEATRHIRSNPRLAGLRVIAMTANAMEEDRQRCLVAGMDDFITKPIDPNLLYLRLANWLPDRGAEITASEPDDEEMPAAVIDLAILGGMVRNDPAKIRSFALKFLKSARETLAEIEAAQARRDLLALGALGHRLKSSARTVGALGFADLCESLEHAGKAGDWPAAEVVLPQLPLLLQRIAERVELQTADLIVKKQ